MERSPEFLIRQCAASRGECVRDVLHRLKQKCADANSHAASYDELKSRRQAKYSPWSLPVENRATCIDRPSRMAHPGQSRAGDSKFPKAEEVSEDCVGT